MEKKIKLLNGLPLGSMPAGCVILCREITQDEAKEFLAKGFDSYIGHVDTANILSNLLSMQIVFNRSSAIFEKDDKIIVASYVGMRLPEGATTLPENSRFRFFLVEVKEG